MGLNAEYGDLQMEKACTWFLKIMCVTLTNGLRKGLVKWPLKKRVEPGGIYHRQVWLINLLFQR